MGDPATVQRAKKRKQMHTNSAIYGLTPKEIRVCDAYLNAGGALNKRSAYSTQYSIRSNNYLEFFRRPDVKEYIQDQREFAMEFNGTSLPRTLAEIAALSFSSMKHISLADHLDEDGCLDIASLPDHVAAAIQTVKVRKERGSAGSTITEIKLHDKPKSLDMLMRYLGAYEKDNKQQAPDVLVNMLEYVAQRGMPAPHEVAAEVAEQVKSANDS